MTELKSIEVHNAEVHAAQEQNRCTGVACDKCGTELEYENLPEVPTIPYPERWVRCRGCSFRTTVLAWPKATERMT